MDNEGQQNVQQININLSTTNLTTEAKDATPSNQSSFQTHETRQSQASAVKEPSVNFNMKTRRLEVPRQSE